MDLSLVTIALISGASEHTGTKEYFQFRMRTMKSKYFENKFDDTRLSSYYENIIGPIIFFSCVMTLQSLSPVGCFSLTQIKWRWMRGQAGHLSEKNDNLAVQYEDVHGFRRPCIDCENL